jgi:hypothetical protein
VNIEKEIVKYNVGAEIIEDNHNVVAIRLWVLDAGARLDMFNDRPQGIIELSDMFNAICWNNNLMPVTCNDTHDIKSPVLLPHELAASLEFSSKRSHVLD